MVAGSEKQSRLNAKAAVELQKFLQTLLLLTASLVVFFASMWLFSPGASVSSGVAATTVLDQLAESKRALLQQTLHWQLVHLKQIAEERATLGTKREQTRVTNAALTVQESAANEFINPDMQKAIQAIDAGHATEAVILLDGILKKDPKNEQALIELAMVYMLDFKQPAAAIQYLQRAMDVNPSNKVVLSELVSLYEEEGRIDEGLGFMLQRAKDHPEATELSFSIGQLFALQGRAGEAIPYLEKATIGSDNPVRVYRNLAQAYSRSGDAERAIDSLSKAIAQQEQDVQDKTQRGEPTTFAEERLNTLRLDQASELVRRGDEVSLDAAQKIIDIVRTNTPELEQISTVQATLERARSSAG